MSILIDERTRVIVQGFTGEKATFHAREMMAYGTNVVGGVTPGKGGTRHLDRPVFNTVKEAVREVGAEASIIFVPAAFCADSIMESANAGIRLVCTITDGIPAQDMMMVKRYLLRVSEGAPYHVDRPELRRHHQRREGNARHHAGTHLFPWLGGCREPLGHTGVRSRRADEQPRASARLPA